MKCRSFSRNSENPSSRLPFDSIHFNLSHCPDLALVAVGTDGPVGIDLERFDRAMDLLECESTFCHPEEIRDCRMRRPCEPGNCSESGLPKKPFSKPGHGLSHPPESTRIVFNEPTSRASFRLIPSLESNSNGSTN